MSQHDQTRQPTSHATQSQRDRQRHEACVEAEVRKLERNLRQLGPMPRDRLADLTRSERWREGSFEEAIAVGVREGRLAWMPFQWLKVVGGSRL